jgi:hypothetical protein
MEHSVNQRSHREISLRAGKLIGTIALASALLSSVPLLAQQAPQFTPGNLVVSVEGCGVNGGTCTGVPSGNGVNGGYGDNQAAPFTLFQFAPVGTTSAAFVNSMVLPQTASGANFPVSGEYGSSSEGTLQLSGNGLFLTMMGYGVNAATFDANPTLFGTGPTTNALGQSGSLTGQSYTAVPRVVALVDAFGNVNSSTVLFNIFNTNNPRSIYTTDGVTSAYVSGQGSGCDLTSGVFFTALGVTNNAPTPITGGDAVPTASCLGTGFTGTLVAQDTRDVQIFNNTLFISIDSTAGKSDNRSLIGTLGTPPATSMFSPTAAPTGDTNGPNLIAGLGNTGGTGKETIAGNGNNFNAGKQINISPENYFFASPSVLYVADSGSPKQTSATSTLGDGGLQKWVNSNSEGTGTWSLAYTLFQGLNLVENTASNANDVSGTTGLYGLTGTVSPNGTVNLYATNFTIADLDPTFLYGITDTLSFTTAAQATSETFTQLAAAPADSNFKGVSFAPVAPVPVTPTITWPAPAAITFGSALSSEQLDATASVPGTFVYNPAAGTVLQAGANQTLSVTFTPTNTNSFTTATATNSITVNPAAATPASLIVTKVLSRTSTNVVVQITISNAGQTTATNVMLTSVKVGSDTATPLPVAVGSIAAGASAQATVSVPASVGASGAASSLTLTGTYNAGNFSSSARITLP